MKRDRIKTDIKLQVTPEQSEAVQKICFNNNIYWAATGSNFEEDNVRYIFIDIDAMTLTYDSTFFHEHKFEEIDVDLFIRTNGTCIEPVETPIEECKFTKYGFEKHKDCVILTEVGSWLIGYVKNGTQAPKPAMWFKHDGGSSAALITVPNLTPIKKPWYETCKFPCLIMADYCMPVVVKHYNDGYVYDFRDNRYCVKSWRLLTNDEIEELKQ